MNNHFSEFLESVKIPCFVLARNLYFEHEYDLDAPVSRGEIIKCSQQIKEVRQLIPRPVIPEDDYKQSLFEKKIGEMKSANANYDDSPFDLAEGDPNDFEIFGESYTIVWFCPPDVEEVTGFLVNKYRNNRDLIKIWENYIDRMHIYPFYSLELTSDDFYEKICDTFEEKVSSLPDPPSKEEWDKLNDFL